MNTVFKNVEKVEKRLLALGNMAERRGTASALRKAATPILNQAKANAQRSDRTGHLRKSLKIKSRTFKKRAYAFVTSDRKYARKIAGRKKLYMPGFIAHLVEFGFKHKQAGQISGTGFMEKAFDSKSDEAINIYGENIKGDVMKEARKLASRV